jgi:cobalt-zinc-cadmium resistance protein CzcA
VSGIATAISSVPGAVDVYPEQISGAPYIDIKINRPAAARYGIDTQTIQDAIEKGIGESNLTVTIEGRRRFPVRVRYAPQFRGSPEALATLPITSPTGAPIPLSQLAEIHTVEGPSMISSENGLLRGTVLLNVRGRDVGSFVDEVKEKIKEKVSLPPGYFVTYGGQFENQQKAMQRLMVIAPIAIGMIFLLLFLTFRSVRLASLVIFNLPFALIGGVLALYITGQYLLIPASVGFIVLFGVAVLNGVVMVSHISQLRAEGRPLDESVVKGAMDRLRPVVMTATIAIFSLIPMLYATGTGSEIQKPLATVVVGGLFTSTILTLFLIPSMYSWFDRKKKSKEELEN